MARHRRTTTVPSGGAREGSVAREHEGGRLIPVTEPSNAPGPSTASDRGDADQGEALERVEESIDEARAAEADVAAHDDITTHDAGRAGAALGGSADEDREPLP